MIVLRLRCDDLETKGKLAVLGFLEIDRRLYDGPTHKHGGRTALLYQILRMTALRRAPLHAAQEEPVCTGHTGDGYDISHPFCSLRAYPTLKMIRKSVKWGLVC